MSSTDLAATGLPATDVPGIDVSGAALAATLITVAATPLLTLLVLWWFRRRVQGSMREPAGPPAGALPGAAPPPGPAGPGGFAPPPSPRSAPPPPPGSAPPPGGPLSALLRERLLRSVAWYVAAGLVYALASTVLWLLLSGQELLGLRVLLVGYVFAWPLLPTLALVCAWTWWTSGLAVVGYLIGMTLLGLLSVGGPGGPLALWALYMVPPTLVIAAVAPRRFRAVGPFLAPAVFAFGTALLVWPWIALAVLEAGASLPVAETAGITVALLPVGAALLVIPAAAWRYRRKAASDQSVLVDQWWLLFALAQTMFTPQFGWSAVVLLLPYAGYLAVLRVGRRLAFHRSLRERPRRLLLLRVFGARGRSERLFGQVSARWRAVGSIELIAGPDLASAALEPHEFLDFARGALSRRFIGDPATLARRLAGIDLWPDRDGRFRVDQFFCRDTAWQPAVAALARSADVVLIDLRGLRPQNDGVAYELTELARCGALERTVGLLDDTTDRTFLNRVLHASAARLPRAVELTGSAAGPGRLLHELAAAAR